VLQSLNNSYLRLRQVAVVQAAVVQVVAVAVPAELVPASVAAEVEPV